MADMEQIEIILQSKDAWNKWRMKNPHKHMDFHDANLIGANLVGVDLIGADLSDANLTGANLSGANLTGANLSGVNLRQAYLFEANLFKANLSGADLSRAHLRQAYLFKANLIGAYLRQAYLREANLFKANLVGADLSGADLSSANLSDASFEGAILTDCKIFAVSAWGLKLNDKTKQSDLIITPYDQPTVTVDSIEVAQFIYLLLNNEKIRGVIDTIAKKAVLILGRFTPERKAVLDALRTELRNRGYLPILFDFDKPSTKDITETIRILAGMSLFVIADITNPKSCPLELQATVPDCMVPFVPIIQESEEPFSMFKDLHIKYKRWVLAPLKYDSSDSLIMALDKAIIKPALQRHDELLREKAAALPLRHVNDYMV